MDDNLRIISLNCYGIKISLCQVYELCEVVDIVLLQETLLFTHELSILSTIHPKFEGMGVSAIDSSSGIISGRPSLIHSLIIYAQKKPDSNNNLFSE